HALFNRGVKHPLPPHINMLRSSQTRLALILPIVADISLGERCSQNPMTIKHVKFRSYSQRQIQGPSRFLFLNCLIPQPSLSSENEIRIFDRYRIARAEVSQSSWRGPFA